MVVFLVFLLLLTAIATFGICKSAKEMVLAAVLAQSVLIVLVTEGLSVFHLLNFPAIATAWGLIIALLAAYLIGNKKQATVVLANAKGFGRQYFESMKIHEKGFAGLIVIILSGFLFQGLVYPPNNWDSLTYHMSRIMYWLGNGSVAHFPTHIFRHLYQPPFAEYVILNVNLLNGNDYLANCVQWFFLLASIVALWSVLDYFKTPRAYKLLGALLLVTIPSVALQASTTKNDIVAGFFVLASCCFALKSYYRPGFRNFILLGFSIGLGMLTKGTAYLFLAPILGIFAALLLVKVARHPKILLYGTVLTTIVLLLNAPHFARNYKINGDILNIDQWEKESYPNSEMNASLLVSNFLKNTGLHVGYPLQSDFDVWIRQQHLAHQVNIDNPATNFLGIPYKGPKEFETHEDLVPNTIHLPLSVFAFFMALGLGLFKGKNALKEVLVATILLGQALLFAGFLKWQPWHTRLHIPLFMFSVILVVITLQRIRPFTLLMVGCLPFLLYNTYFNFVYNNTRPIITNTKYTKKIGLGDLRFKKYFSNQLNLYPEYATIVKLMYARDPKKIGLIMADWEYPLFYAYYYDKIELRALTVGNATNKIPQDTSNIDMIISTTKSPDLFYNSRAYINRTPENAHVWAYTLQ